MKQYISKEQMDELSPKAATKYIEYCKGKDWGKVTVIGIVSREGEDRVQTEAPALSIGQMIEFLGDEYIHAIHEYGSIESVEAKKVCDALWEAVKERLEK